MSVSILKDAVAENVRILRKRNGWTQQELAEMLPGWYQEDISNLENGKHEPRLDTLEKLSEIFGVTAAKLLKTIQNG